MAQVEHRLGRAPRSGAWDTAFDAHSVYDYFPQARGFAAVPLNRGNHGGGRPFDSTGRPLCAASLAMQRRLVYQDRTAL